MRLVVVLGYSRPRDDGLHPICRARLAHAATVALSGDVVVLSGWSRRARSRSEAALMQEAWAGEAHELVLDEGARSTFENARHALRIADRLGASELVVVTSSWHSRRALAAFRGQRGGRDLAIAASPAPARAGWRAARELALLPVLSLQVARRGAPPAG